MKLMQKSRLKFLRQEHVRGLQIADLSECCQGPFVYAFPKLGREGPLRPAILRNLSTAAPASFLQNPETRTNLENASTRISDIVTFLDGPL